MFATDTGLMILWLSICLVMCLVFLVAGYWMGRNSAGLPVSVQAPILNTASAPMEEDPYETAMRPDPEDPGERVDTT